jgi:hypothetical protein
MFEVLQGELERFEVVGIMMEVGKVQGQGVLKYG